jgi:hypothetical protein
MTRNGEIDKEMMITKTEDYIIRTIKVYSGSGEDYVSNRLKEMYEKDGWYDFECIDMDCDDIGEYYIFHIHKGV